ncbi:unnamed protein product [Lampetra fluviatilis]
MAGGRGGGPMEKDKRSAKSPHLRDGGGGGGGGAASSEAKLDMGERGNTPPSTDHAPSSSLTTPLHPDHAPPP